MSDGLGSRGRNIWEVGEREDSEEEFKTSTSSPLTRAIEYKLEEDKTEEERWDSFLRSNVNKIENWREEKTGIGPEPLLVPNITDQTSRATLYADDNSAGEVGKTVGELKTKTENMLNIIFKHMRESRLLINAGKTKVLLFATRQKRSRNDLSFHLDIEGNQIEEEETATLLGVTWTNNFSWDTHIDEVIGKCSTRLNGLYKVQRELSKEQRKNLAEGAILSRLRYALELISSGSDRNIKRLESMQSKSARYVLQRSRREWSRSGGYEELQWLTIPQTAVEFSLRLFFKILWTKKPGQLYESIYDEEKEEVRRLSQDEIVRMTKLARKTWRVRVLRYSEVVPEDLYDVDPQTYGFKSSLKEWVKSNVHKDGDDIFRGNVPKQTDSEDWLNLELQAWQKRTQHNFMSIEEYEAIVDQDSEEEN